MNRLPSSLFLKRSSDKKASPYELQLQEGFPWLVFQGVLEEEFQKSYELQMLKRIRPALLIGFLAFAAFGAWDYFLLPPEVCFWTFIVRFGVVYPVLGLTWFSSTHPRLQAYIASFAWFSISTAGLGVVAVVILARWYVIPLPYEGILLVIMATYLLTGLLFYHALTCAILISLVYLLGEFLLGYPMPMWISNGIFLIFANLIGICGCYTLEQNIRSDFLKSKWLESLVDLDGLTGIYNRRMFDEYFPRLWGQACREKKPLMIALLDVDYFKKFNDTYGHLAGDECLKQVASRLSEVAKRPLDLAARYGGEEFVLIRFNAGKESLSPFAQEICCGISALKIPHQASEIADHITVSVGIVLHIPDEEDSLESFLEEADQALYEAKQKGRNQATIRTLA
jgi:diguanylate cyclase (GGDEF)-like protein